MKHTDFALIFMMIFLSIIIEYDFKIKSLHEISNQGIIYNNIFDTAVTDALRNGLKTEGAEPVINEELVMKQLFDGLNELIEIDMSSFPAIIITNSRGFIIWNNGERNELIYEDSTIETKISQIKTAVEDALNSSTAAIYNGFTYTISIPYANANEWYNTISDLGILIVYQGNTYNNDKMFNRYIVSGASFENAESR